MRINEIEIPDTIDGKPTRNNLGELIHPTVEGIRNFWNWFGDSKVVDSQGRPLVVSHGSRDRFAEFREKRGGMYFTTDGAIAMALFTQDGIGDLMRCYLSMKNPFDARWKSMSDGQKDELRKIIYSVVDDSDIEDAAAKLEVPIEDADPFEVFTDGEFFWGYGRGLQNSVLEEIRLRGYDGVIFPDALTLGEPHVSYVAFRANQIKSAIGNNGNFSVSSNKITEIGFAHALGELSIPHSEIVAKSVKDGTIFGKPVRVFTSGESKLYFFEHENEIAALVLVDGNFVRAIKSFNGEKGLVFALVNYLVNIKNMKLKIGADEPLTPEGFQWLLKLISANSGLKIRDQSGNTVDPEKLKSEWNQSKISMGTQSGPTELTISESDAKWKTKLQMNEKRMIPFVYFKC